MAEPDYATLAAVVLASDAAFHTRSAPVFEQIRNRVWFNYRNTDGKDIPQWNPPDDVNGLGDTIYAAFVAAGLTALIGGAAYALEQIGNIVLTYPYTRGSTPPVTPADYIDRFGF